jgi:SAM-dependent methyltransferase
VRNISDWRPTKVGITPTGHLTVPGASRAVSAGSILITALVADWYARHIPQFARGTLLELGCGKMPFFQLYRPHVREIICTDWPSTLHGNQHVDFVSDLNVGVPVSDSAVDTVIASDVLEHLYKPGQLLAEIFRVLRPGGFAFVNVPFLYWTHEAPHDYFRYTRFALSRMAAEAKLEIVRQDCIGGAVYVIADLFGKLVQPTPVLGRHIAAAVQKGMLLGRRTPSSDRFPLFIGTILRRPDGASSLDAQERPA